MKTLKEILQLEVYEPKSPDEKRFKDKHVVVKHKDANGNNDDLFNAKNIKTVDREPMHGYNPGEDEKVYEEVEELDERQMNVYAIATAQVKKKHGLTGNNVDLTKAQTVEAHQLAKKIAKRMGVSLKESAQEEYKRKFFRGGTRAGKPGSTAEASAYREAMKIEKAMKKVAPKKEEEEESTHKIMLNRLGMPLIMPPPKYPEEMTGPEEEGPDGRYGGPPQVGGVYRDPKTGGTFIGKWPEGVEPKSPRNPRKPRSKK